MKKMRVGWFTFTCCEGCMIVFLELMNDYFLEWKEKIDFKYIKTLKSNNKLTKLDLAIVEGAISTMDEFELLKKIREKSKYIMAVGSCAVTGMPAGLRNNFDEKRKNEINHILKKFNYLEKVEPVSKYVKIDSSVNGCPMDENAFINELDKYLRMNETNNKEKSKD